MVAVCALGACDKGEKKDAAASASAKPSAAPSAKVTASAAQTAAASASAAASAEAKGPTAATISKDQAKKLVAEMNELCPDTWCEGEFDFKFKSIDCQPKKCKLAFNAKKHGAKAAQDDSIEIAYEGAILDAKGDETDPWNDALTKAIEAWETNH